MELRLLLITHMPSFMGLAETPADTCGRLRFGIAACLESVAELRVESIPRETQMIRHETHCVGAERLAEYGERERVWTLADPGHRAGSCDRCTMTAWRCTLRMIAMEV